MFFSFPLPLFYEIVSVIQARLNEFSHLEMAYSALDTPKRLKKLEVVSLADEATTVTAPLLVLPLLRLAGTEAMQFAF